MDEGRGIAGRFPPIVTNHEWIITYQDNFGEWQDSGFWSCRPWEDGIELSVIEGFAREKMRERGYYRALIYGFSANTGNKVLMSVIEKEVE